MDARVEKILDIITDEFKGAEETVGILAHGSHIRGQAHPKSDVDILCVTNVNWLSKEIRVMEGIEVEIQQVPEAKIRGDLGTRYPTNHNYFMNVFTSGKILYDRTGVLKEITEEAFRMKDEGPPEANRFEMLMGQSFFRHRMDGVRRQMANPETQPLGRISMALEFHNAVFAYCKRHRRWSSRLDYILNEFKSTDPDFYNLCQGFLNTLVAEEQLAYLEKIVDAVIDEEGWENNVAYKTPRMPIQTGGKIKDGLLF